MEISEKFTTDKKIAEIKNLPQIEKDKLLPKEEAKTILSEVEYLNADLLAELTRSIKKLVMVLK